MQRTGSEEVLHLNACGCVVIICFVCVCVCGCVLLRMYRRIVLHIHMCKPTQGHLHVIGELNIVWAMRDSNLCNCYSSHIAGGIKNDLFCQTEKLYYTTVLNYRKMDVSECEIKLSIHQNP